ncbi:unnamed protein product [Malus baccata var. baccata]
MKRKLNQLQESDGQILLDHQRLEKSKSLSGVETSEYQGAVAYGRSPLSLRLKVAMQPSSFRYVNNCLTGCRSTVDELGEPLDENESDRDRMMRLSSFAKFKENKQLVNDARKTSKALADAIRLKDENFESLKRQNGENVRLKKQLEATKEQLETTILEVTKVKRELDSALVEGEAFVLAIDPNSDDDSDNEASISEQSQESEDGPGDAEESGDDDGTHSDIVGGSASDDDDS